MDNKNPLISRLNKAAPGAVLEVRRFGRSPVFSIWVEAQTILQIAEVLKNDVEFKLDWLENLSVVEFEGVHVVSYFLRSTVTRQAIVVRLSTPGETPVPSIQKVWPMGQPMERDIYEMFGIRFQGAQQNGQESSTVLPAGWKGFPLRKDYTFPKEYLGIQHSRVNSSRPFQKKKTE